MQIREVSWSEIKDKVAATNSTLYDSMSSAANYPASKLYLARYKFGDLIVNNGVTQLPINNQLVKLDHPDLPEPFKTDLYYSRMCAGIFLNKTAEIFVDLETRIHPLHMFNIGDVYGLWELLDSKESPYYHRVWNLAAGARSLFMTPKAMDNSSHTRMQRLLNLHESYPPNNMFQQGVLFKNITESKRLHNDWRCEVLYLSRGWFESLPEKERLQFQYTCLKQEWAESTHARNRLTFDVIWQVLSQTQSDTRLKPNIYIIESVKNLANIAIGSALGFKPLSANDEHIAPISIIEKAYLESYKLKHYIPTLLAPSYLNHKNTDSVYYSFMLPTLLALTNEHNFRNTLEDERNAKNLLERFLKKLEQKSYGIEHLINNTAFDFFHYEADPLYQIKASKNIPEQDTRFSTYKDKQRRFCENGPFIRSCVRIKPKEKIS